MTLWELWLLLRHYHEIVANLENLCLDYQPQVLLLTYSPISSFSQFSY